MQVEKLPGGERRVGETQIYVVGPGAADHVEALRDAYPGIELIPAEHPPADPEAPFVFTDPEKQARKEAAERQRTITLLETAGEGNRRERRRRASLGRRSTGR